MMNKIHIEMMPWRGFDFGDPIAEMFARIVAFLRIVFTLVKTRLSRLILSSEYFDAELGLVYYNYRHYNPTCGRFLSRDPIAESGGFNLYASCKNNLQNHYDRYGKFIEETIKSLLDAADCVYRSAEESSDAVVNLLESTINQAENIAEQTSSSINSINQWTVNKLSQSENWLNNNSQIAGAYVNRNFGYVTNFPNTVVGLTVGFGSYAIIHAVKKTYNLCIDLTKSKYKPFLVFPEVEYNNGVLEFFNQEYMPGAITLGHTINYGMSKFRSRTDLTIGNRTIYQHELQHIPQGEYLSITYLPAHAGTMVLSIILSIVSEHFYTNPPGLTNQDPITHRYNFLEH